MFEDSADLDSRITTLPERVLRRHAGQLLALKLRDRLSLGEGFGHRLAVQLCELRPIVERFQVRRPSRHVKEDDSLRFRRHVSRADQAIPPRDIGRRFHVGVVAEKRRESRHSQAACGCAEKRSSAELCSLEGHDRFQSGLQTWPRMAGLGLPVFLLARNGLMQIEYNPCDSGPGSIFRERDVLGLRGFPGANDLFGSRLVGREPLHLPRDESGQRI